MELDNFSIWPNRNKTPDDKRPDYTISAKVGDIYEEVGACWKRVNEKTNKVYLSCKIGGPKKKEERSQYESSGKMEHSKEFIDIQADAFEKF